MLQCCDEANGLISCCCCSRRQPSKIVLTVSTPPPSAITKYESFFTHQRLLRRRRCGIQWCYDIHAGFQYGSLRFPRRIVQGFVRLGEEIVRYLAGGDAGLLYVGHDYQPGGRELVFQSSIGGRKKNIKLLTSQMAKIQVVALNLFLVCIQYNTLPKLHTT
jgi:hypothetical protein